MFFFLLVSIVTLVLMSLFYSLSKKEKWLNDEASTFEAGFFSHFFSRNSFSIHYFLVALIFLFLDLELSLLMPFLTNQQSDTTMYIILNILLTILIWGLIKEWKEKKLNWKF